MLHFITEFQNYILLKMKRHLSQCPSSIDLVDYEIKCFQCPRKNSNLNINLVLTSSSSCFLF